MMVMKTIRIVKIYLLIEIFECTLHYISMYTFILLTTFIIATGQYFFYKPPILIIYIENQQKSTTKNMKYFEIVIYNVIKMLPHQHFSFPFSFQLNTKFNLKMCLVPVRYLINYIYEVKLLIKKYFQLSQHKYQT